MAGPLLLLKAAVAKGKKGTSTAPSKELLTSLKDFKKAHGALKTKASMGEYRPTGGHHVHAKQGMPITSQERLELGAFNSSIFDKKIAWTSPSGTHQTYKVYQRTDIDWTMVRTVGDKRFIGKTNAEAAKSGLAPQLKDKSFATLHHIGQNSKGPLVEASTHLHSFESKKLSNGKRPFDVLHSLHGSKTKHPELPVNHDLFKLEAKEYWQGRIRDFTN